jgi:hypothetical protein
MTKFELKSLNLYQNITIMTTMTLRKEVQHYISQADERFLKMVRAMSKVYESKSVIGYTTQGKPITNVELRKRVTEASKRVKSGDFIAHEELEKEVKNW